MRYKKLGLSFTAMLAMFILCGRTSAQNPIPMDWDLSLLRGAWQYHTFDEKWTLSFDCDHKMLFDRDPADYTLTPGIIRVQGDDGLTDYPYKLEGDDLTLTLPDGSERTYRKTDAGTAEQTIRGDFYASGGSSSDRERISFDGDHVFAFHLLSSVNPGQSQSAQQGVNSNYSMVEGKGVYRIEGDGVVMTLDDSTIYEAQIRFRDEDGSVEGIIFDNSLFETDHPAASSSSTQVSAASSQPGVVPYYVPQPPPYVISTPPVYAVPPPAPAASSKSHAEKSNSQPRVVGSKREKAGGR